MTRPYKKKTEKQKLRDRADDLWKKLCLKRAGNKCELTEQVFGLQVHHFFPRITYPMLRYDLENGIVLKKGLHFNHHTRGDPTIHERIIRKRGKEWYDELLKRSHIRLRNSLQTKNYYENIINELKEAIKSESED